VQACNNPFPISKKGLASTAEKAIDNRFLLHGDQAIADVDDFKAESSEECNVA